MTEVRLDAIVAMIVRRADSKRRARAEARRRAGRRPKPLARDVQLLLPLSLPAPPSRRGAHDFARKDADADDRKTGV